MLDVPKTVHRSLLAGATLAAAVLAVLRRTAPPPASVPVMVLRYTALATAAAVAVAISVARRRIPGRVEGGDVAAWWRVALGPALVVWALAESVILVGSTFYYLSGDLVPVGVAGLGLLLMVLAAPDRLADE